MSKYFLQTNQVTGEIVGAFTNIEEKPADTFHFTYREVDGIAFGLALLLGEDGPLFWDKLNSVHSNALAQSKVDKLVSNLKAKPAEAKPTKSKSDSLIKQIKNHRNMKTKPKSKSK